jgi:predicted phage gp36 major capsid-like protein
MEFTQEQINRTNDLRTAKQELQRHTARLTKIINNRRSAEPGGKRSTPQEVAQAKEERERLLAASRSNDTDRIYAEIERHKRVMPEKQKIAPKSKGEIDSLLIDKLNRSRQ